MGPTEGRLLALLYLPRRGSHNIVGPGDVIAETRRLECSIRGSRRGRDCSRSFHQVRVLALVARQCLVQTTLVVGLLACLGAFLEGVAQPPHLRPWLTTSRRQRLLPDDEEDQADRYGNDYFARCRH